MFHISDNDYNYEDTSAIHAAWGGYLQTVSIAHDSLARATAIPEVTKEQNAALCNAFLATLGNLIGMEKYMKERGVEPALSILDGPLATIRQAAITVYSSHGQPDDIDAFWSAIGFNPND